jgi:hypothetical protein
MGWRKCGAIHFTECAEEPGYKAPLAWVIEQWIEMPNTHSYVRGVNPAGPESRTHNLPWEIFESVQ